MDVSIQETSHDEADAVDVPDESIYNLKLGIEKLFSAMEPLCKHYWDLNNKLLKRGVGSQLYKLIPLSAFRLVCKEKFSPFLFRMDQTKLITMNAKTESKINETLSKIQSTAKKSNIVFDFEQTSQLFTLGLMREQDSAQNNNSTSYKSNPDSDDYYKYLSFGERKILEGIKRNETLLERLLEKLESDE